MMKIKKRPSKKAKKGYLLYFLHKIYKTNTWGTVEVAKRVGFEGDYFFISLARHNPWKFWGYKRHLMVYTITGGLGKLILP